MRDALSVELLKLRSSTVTWISSLIAVLFAPLLGIAFVILAESDGVGALAGKLDGMIIGTGWEAYLGSTGQMVAVAFFLAVGFLSVWSFGREFAEGTVESLFALRVSRSQTAAAKAIVLVGWLTSLALCLVVAVAVIGFVAGLDVGEQKIPLALLRIGLLAVLSGLLATTLSFVASVGRGYLAGVGALIATVAVSQFAVLFGLGGWFPYASPGLWAVSWQDPGIMVTIWQLALVPLFVTIALGMTVNWWRRFQLV